MEPGEKTILLGITGSIAAPKSIELAGMLISAGHQVRAVLTPSARDFIDRDELEQTTGRQPLCEPPPFTALEQPDFTHLELADCDLMVVAPATANTIGKMANGIADNLLLSTYLAFERGVLICPAMNQRMWMHPAVQDNVNRLRETGVEMVPPAEGKLACGEEGIGRLAEPAEIADRVTGMLQAAVEPDMGGMRVLVTAGGTREPLDAVRFIGNRSSGKMGFSIAEAARRRGADVTLVSANCAQASHNSVRRVDVATVSELENVVKKEFEQCDVLVMAAAVSDYRVSSESTMGKQERGEEWHLQLLPTADIVSGLSSADCDKLKVGFAAEFGKERIGRARRKLREKDLDMIVFNDISRDDIGFDSDYNELTILTRGGSEVEVKRASKLECAHKVLDKIIELVDGNLGGI